MLPTELPFGPQPRPQDWQQVLNQVRFTIEQASSLDRGEADDQMDELYTAWADKAEIELHKATGADTMSLGNRGKQPKMV